MHILYSFLLYLSMCSGVTPHTCVIPVKTGIQTLLLFPKRIWIPVFTGMTKEKKDKGEDWRCEGLRSILNIPHSMRDI